MNAFRALVVVLVSALSFGCDDGFDAIVESPDSPSPEERFQLVDKWTIGDGASSTIACDNETCAISRIDVVGSGKPFFQLIDHDGGLVSGDAVLPNSNFGINMISPKTNGGYFVLSSDIDAQLLQNRYLTSLDENGDVLLSTENGGNGAIAAIAPSNPTSKFVTTFPLFSTEDSRQLVCFIDLNDDGTPGTSLCTEFPTNEQSIVVSAHGFALIGTAMGTGIVHIMLNQSTGELFYQLSLMIQDGNNTFVIPISMEFDSVIVQPTIEKVFAINGKFQVLWNTNNGEERFMTVIDPTNPGSGLSRPVPLFYSDIVVNGEHFVATEGVFGQPDSSVSGARVILLDDQLRELTRSTTCDGCGSGDNFVTTIVAPNITNVRDGRVLVTWTEGFITEENGQQIIYPETFHVRAAMFDLPAVIPAP